MNIIENSIGAVSPDSFMNRPGQRITRGHLIGWLDMVVSDFCVIELILQAHKARNIFCHDNFSCINQIMGNTQHVIVNYNTHITRTYLISLCTCNGKFVGMEMKMMVF